MNLKEIEVVAKIEADIRQELKNTLIQYTDEDITKLAVQRLRNIQKELQYTFTFKSESITPLNQRIDISLRADTIIVSFDIMSDFISNELFPYFCKEIPKYLLYEPPYDNSMTVNTIYTLVKEANKQRKLKVQNESLS